MDTRFLLKDGKKHPLAILVPGGGYYLVCSFIEGVPIARKLNKKGISCVIVYYSVKKKALCPAPIDDLARGVKEILSKALSVRKAESLAAKVLSKKKLSETETAGSDSEQIDYAKEVSTLLTKKFGRKVRLVEGRKTGKIEIEYYSPDDRETLLSQLNSLNF